VTWRSALLQRLQEVRGNCKTRNQLHVIATSGGWDAEAKQGRHLDYVPYPMLRKKWQWHLLTMLRQTVKRKEIQGLVDTCYTRYREGCVSNVPKGEVPAR
jgi:hypothetical protein